MCDLQKKKDLSNCQYNKLLLYFPTEVNQAFVPWQIIVKHKANKIIVTKTFLVLGRKSSVRFSWG